jgi:hypothetical protein
MNKLLLNLQGLSANDYERLHTSIVQDLIRLHKIIPNYQEDVPLLLQNWLEAFDWDIGDWLTSIDEFKFIIDKSLRNVIRLIKSGQLNDPKFYSQVAELCKVIKQYDGQWYYVDAPPQIDVFYHFYDNQYITQVVKPYNLSLIMEAIYVIKDNTPILDDNICDILSFLNDEKHFTKHQVDTEIYAIE